MTTHMVWNDVFAYNYHLELLMVGFNFSVFTEAGETSGDVSMLAGVLNSATRAMGKTDRWEGSPGGFWCCVTPHEDVRRSRERNFHLPATPASTETMLARWLPMLLAAGSAFKSASTINHVAQLDARSPMPCAEEASSGESQNPVDRVLPIEGYGEVHIRPNLSSDVR